MQTKSHYRNIFHMIHFILHRIQSEERGTVGTHKSTETGASFWTGPDDLLDKKRMTEYQVIFGPPFIDFISLDWMSEYQ